MRLEVRPIDLESQIEPFIRFQWRIYQNDRHWVPPLLWERKQFLHPLKNPFFRSADVQAFMAFQDGEPVGTIAATVDHQLQKTEPATGLFGFFEFIEDIQVARALLQRAMDWLQEQGMEEARGPCNFTLNHEAGLLVDGFDKDPVVLTTYNPEYYKTIYQRIGLKPVQDLYGWWIQPNAVPPRIQAIAERVASRHPDLTLRPINLSDFPREVSHALDIYHDSWRSNWGHSPIGEAEFKVLAKGLKPMIHPRLAWFVETADRPVAMAICLLDYNQAVKPMNGRIWPWGWIRLARARRAITHARVFLLGVRPSHQHIALGASLYARIWEEAISAGLSGVEASWILESNHKMNGALKKLGASRYKTWRLYSIPLRRMTVF